MAKNIPSTANERLRGHCSCPQSIKTCSNCSKISSVISSL